MTWRWVAGRVAARYLSDALRALRSGELDEALMLARQAVRCLE